MEQIINRIIEIEQQAKEIVTKAEQKRDSLPEEMKEALEKMRTAYQKEAEIQIATAKQEEYAHMEKITKKIDTTHQTQMEKIEKALQAHQNEWVEQIFQNVIQLEA